MQSALTLTIVVIFWAFVTLFMFQFITGLFVSADGANIIVSVSNVNVIAPTTSISEVITPQVQPFKQLPDPWGLETEVVHHNSNEAVVLSLPTLRLLPPVKEISLQPERVNRSKKSDTVVNKPSKTKKADVKSPGSRLPIRPRKAA